MSPLYDAIVAKQVVTISYKSFRATEPHDIRFSPYILKEYNNRWFVFGRGEKDRYVINLALDRIVSVRVDPDGAFIEDGKFDPDTWFDDIVGVTKRPGLTGKRERVRFVATKDFAPYIETKPIHRSQFVVERREDESVVFQLDVVPNFELERALLEYAEGVKVLSPQHFVSQITRRLNQAAKTYEI